MRGRATRYHTAGRLAWVGVSSAACYDRSVKPRLLQLLVCRECGDRFELDVFQSTPRASDEYGGPCKHHGGTHDASDALCSECYGLEVIEGALRCIGCKREYPIIEGVPRILEPALLATLKDRHPSFFSRHPEFDPRPQQPAPSDPHPLLDTLESFTRQRLDLKPPGPEFAAQWHEHFRKVLGPSDALADLRGRLVVDLGCGFGRHLYSAAEAGAEVIGVDLSGGVDRAWQNTLHFPKVHVVQADLFALPVSDGTFDIAWSFGVLHHLPDPLTGFRVLVSLARPGGGLVAIWVYGYEGMAFTYRLSHLRSLRRLLADQGPRARVAASKLVAAALSLAYWLPLRLLGALGGVHRLRRLPLSEQAVQGWSARVAAVHDRLSTPITHYHDRPELLDWFSEAALVDVEVTDTIRRGWRAHGRRIVVV